MDHDHTFRLDSKRSSIVFSWTDGIPKIEHLGSLLPIDLDLRNFVQSRVLPLPYGTLDQVTPVNLHPEIATGFEGHPAMIARRPHGKLNSWAGRFVFKNLDRFENGGHFHLLDAERELSLQLTCLLDPISEVFIFKTTIENLGNTEIMIDWLSAPAIALPQHLSESLSFHGRWCAEFSIKRQTVQIGQLVKENRSGRTSQESFPGLILLEPKTDEMQGNCIGIHLGWSGNHRLILERLPNGEAQVQMGVLHLPGEGTLQPGQSIETPDLYVANSESGLNDLSHRFHHYIRHSILKFPDPAKPRPVTINTWEALYFNHDQKQLRALADAASNVGAERFVLDDGWFRGRNDDTSSLGDWFPDQEKYPDGLGALIQYVRSKGMEFGLWVEPEMVNSNSDLYRAHPDWALQVSPYPIVTGRNQLVLDLTNSKVAHYLYARLSDLLTNNQISYLKWDMNRVLVLPGDHSGNAVALKQTKALYQLIERLRISHPNVEIESCASGGARVDFEILKRTHRFWASDSNDAVERMRIQMGFSYFFPPEVMGAHIGPTWCHTSGRGFHTNFQALVAGFGHLGMELDLTEISTTHSEILKETIKRYKKERQLWHSGKLYRIHTIDPSLLGVSVVSQDLQSARVIMVQLDRSRSTIPPLLKVPGLDENQMYQVQLQSEIQSAKLGNRKFNNPLFTKGFKIQGSVLERVGIQLPVFYAQTGIAISITAIR